MAQETIGREAYPSGSRESIQSQTVADPTVISQLEQFLRKNFSPTIKLLSADPASNRATFEITLPQLFNDELFWEAVEGGYAIRSKEGPFLIHITEGNHGWIIPSEHDKCNAIVRSMVGGAKKAAIARLDEIDPNWRSKAKIQLPSFGG